MFASRQKNKRATRLLAPLHTTSLPLTLSSLYLLHSLQPRKVHFTLALQNFNWHSARTRNSATFVCAPPNTMAVLASPSAAHFFFSYSSTFSSSSLYSPLFSRQFPTIYSSCCSSSKSFGKRENIAIKFLSNSLKFYCRLASNTQQNHTHTHTHTQSYTHSLAGRHTHQKQEFLICTSLREWERKNPRKKEGKLTTLVCRKLNTL